MQDLDTITSSLIEREVIYMRKGHFEFITSILQGAMEQKGNIQEVKLNQSKQQENTKHQGPEKGQCSEGCQGWRQAPENDLKIKVIHFYFLCF